MQDDTTGMGPDQAAQDPTPQVEAVPPVSTPPRRKMFEDFFPKLNLSESAKKDVVEWLIRDLKKCVQNVEAERNNWALWRSVFALEYVEKFYPSMGLGANFSSGLLCERTLEGIDRLKLSLFSPRPWFCVDEKTSNIEDIDFIHRAEWFMHTVLESDLELEDVIAVDGLFEFILDGSLIMEADQMYEVVPQRSIKTYLTVETLQRDMDRALDEDEFQRAVQTVTEGRPARLLIEEDVVTKNGLQFFRVDKTDHLIPPNVFTDRDIRFRGRRMYLTENDLRLLVESGWYEKADVDQVISKRAFRRMNYRMARTGAAPTPEVAKDEVEVQSVWDLCYDWRTNEDNLGGNVTSSPWKNTFAVYRVLCKYGYKTKSDAKGLIPKYCLMDLEPESMTLLRAQTFPHFKEKPNYFHFKLGFKPKSYYGFGYGQRLINEDFLESNAVDLTLDGAAMASFRPLLAKHPEEGGYTPFKDGIGPFKVGYVSNPRQDVVPFEIPPPSPMLLNVLLPLTQTRAANRTNVTALMQGHPESTDPRSPAAKTAMMLREAQVGITSMIKDWNKGWEKLADFVWDSSYEMAVYAEETEIVEKIIFPGSRPELEKHNKIAVEELAKKIKWKSQAASDYVNAQVREDTFLKELQFFTPMLQAVAQFNPPLFKKYFWRWMRMAAEVMEIRGFRYLIPSEEEMVGLGQEQMQAMTQNMMTTLRSGQAPETLNTPEAQAKVGGPGEAGGVNPLEANALLQISGE